MTPIAAPSGTAAELRDHAASILRRYFDHPSLQEQMELTDDFLQFYLFFSPVYDWRAALSSFGLDQTPC